MMQVRVCLIAGVCLYEAVRYQEQAVFDMLGILYDLNTVLTKPLVTLSGNVFALSYQTFS